MTERFFSVHGSIVSLNVKARPGYRENAILGVHGAELVVAVRAPAEKGRANAEIARVLSRILRIPRCEVVLKRGATSTHKIFHLPLDVSFVLEKMEPDK
jgi:uncharacterized protein (TIGR00251 family)